MMTILFIYLQYSLLYYYPRWIFIHYYYYYYFIYPMLIFYYDLFLFEIYQIQRDLPIEFYDKIPYRYLLYNFQRLYSDDHLLYPIYYLSPLFFSPSVTC